MCLCYLFSAKTAWQLVNRKSDFFLQNESIRYANRIDSNHELECSIASSGQPSVRGQLKNRTVKSREVNFALGNHLITKRTGQVIH